MDWKSEKLFVLYFSAIANAEGFQLSESVCLRLWQDTQDSNCLLVGRSPMKKRCPRFISSFECPLTRFLCETDVVSELPETSEVKKIKNDKMKSTDHETESAADTFFFILEGLLK